jgi:hypothetical protein
VSIATVDISVVSQISGRIGDRRRLRHLGGRGEGYVLARIRTRPVSQKAA